MQIIPGPAGAINITKIATQSPSGASSVSFTGIDTSGYKFLYMVANHSGSSNNAHLYLTFNDDVTNGHYSSQRIVGNGGTVTDTDDAIYTRINLGINSSSYKGIIEMMIYCGANGEQKSVSYTNNVQPAGINIGGGYWTNAADAISKITITLEAGTFQANSYFELFGVS